MSERDRQQEAVSALYDALVAHFTFHPRADAEGIAHNAIATLLALPVELRMEAMGMTKVGKWDGDGLYAVHNYGLGEQEFTDADL